MGLINTASGVAIRSGEEVKIVHSLWRTHSRSCCDLSPWMHDTGQPSRFMRRVRSSALRFVSTKISVLFSFSCDKSSRIFCSLRTKTNIMNLTYLTVYIVIFSVMRT